MSDIPALVDDDEALHRAVNPRSNAITVDGKIHYMAFYSSTLPHRMSVDRASYRAIADSLRDWPGCGLAKLIAKAVRAISITPSLRVDGVPEGGNDAHAEIIADETLSKNKVKTMVCVKLADIASLCVSPPPPDPANM